MLKLNPPLLMTTTRLVAPRKRSKFTNLSRENALRNLPNRLAVFRFAIDPMSSLFVTTRGAFRDLLSAGFPMNDPPLLGSPPVPPADTQLVYLALNPFRLVERLRDQVRRRGAVRAPQKHPDSGTNNPTPLHDSSSG